MASGSPGENMRVYYSQRAPEYEQIYYRDNPQRRQELTHEADRLRTLVEGKDVLELACGTGYWTRIMADSASSVLASDLSTEMLRVAAERCTAGNVTFIPADLYTHDFGVELFDAVALGFWFSHHPKQEYARLFDILDRPLKSDGVVWMVDNNPPAEGPRMESVGADEFGNNYKKRHLDDGREFVILKNYFEKRELEAILGERFLVKSLVHNPYYWSAVLGKRT